MSLIYDALRAPVSDEKPGPSYGSVSVGGTPSARRVIGKRALWAGGVVAALGVLVLAAGSVADRLQATAPSRAQAAAVTALAAPPPAASAASAQARQPQSVARVEVVAPRLAPARGNASESTGVSATTRAGAPQAGSAAAGEAAIGAAPAARNVVPARAPAASAPASPSRQPVQAAERPAQRTAQGSAGPEASRHADAVIEPVRIDVGEALGRFNRMVARGEFGQAASLLEQLRAGGLNPLARARMSGYLALRAGRLDDARHAYQEVLSRLPEDREAGLNLAMVDLAQGFNSQAQQRLRRLLDLRPDDGKVQALLAQARAQGGAQ